MFGYKRAAAAILGLEAPLPNLELAERRLPKVPGIPQKRIDNGWSLDRLLAWFHTPSTCRQARSAHRVVRSVIACFR